MVKIKFFWKNSEKVVKCISMKKKLLIIAGVVLLAIVAYFVIWGRPKKPVFEVKTVSPSEMSVTVSASGVIKAEKDSTLAFQTSGMLAWVGIKENDKVKQWQAIASLDKNSLKKQFEKQMNLYLTNRWDFEQTQDNYKQTKENRLVTDSIQRILDKTQFSLNNAVLEVEIADLTVKFATIYAPFDGVVIFANPDYAGINITPSSASYRIVDPKSIYFQIQVDETDVVKIKTGNEVKVTLDAYPAEEFNGEVKKIDFNSTLTSGGGTAYNVFVSLPANDNEKFRLGMNGDAKIVADKIEKALIVPISAIREKGGKTYVWKIQNGKATQAEVKTGASNDEFIQIVSGLNEGDKIVSSNTGSLKEGMKVAF